MNLDEKWFNLEMLKLFFTVKAVSDIILEHTVDNFKMLIDVSQIVSQ